MQTCSGAVSSLFFFVLVQKIYNAKNGAGLLGNRTGWVAHGCDGFTYVRLFRVLWKTVHSVLALRFASCIHGIIWSKSTKRVILNSACELCWTFNISLILYVNKKWRVSHPIVLYAWHLWKENRFSIRTRYIIFTRFCPTVINYWSRINNFPWKRSILSPYNTKRINNFCFVIPKVS